MGWSVHGLDDALRVFEIHPGQCGVMVYAADALAAAFVLPHTDDYRLLHASLVQDLYGELVHQYALYGGPVQEFEALLKARVQPPQRPRTTKETSVTRGSHPGNGREIASCEAALQRPDRRPQHRSTRKGWLP